MGTYKIVNKYQFVYI